MSMMFTTAFFRLWSFDPNFGHLAGASRGCAGGTLEANVFEVGISLIVNTSDEYNATSVVEEMTKCSGGLREVESLCSFSIV